MRETRCLLPVTASYTVQTTYLIYLGSRRAISVNGPFEEGNGVRRKYSEVHWWKPARACETIEARSSD